MVKDYKNYSVSNKIRYFSNLSKKGAVDESGNLLSDFQRGVNFGKAQMLSYCASKIRKSKVLSTNKKLDMNIRNYSDEELNSLFDNSKDLFTNLND